MPPTSGRRHVALHTSAIERSSAATTSSARWAPSRTTCSPPTTTSRTSLAVAPKTSGGHAVVAIGAGEAGAVEADGHEIGEVAGGELRRPASRGRRSRSSSPRRAATPASGCRAARSGRRSSSSTARASSNGSMTACESEPSAEPRRVANAAVGPIPSARSRSVVGQMQQRRTGVREQLDVEVGEVRGVDGGEPLVELRRARTAARRGCGRTRPGASSFSFGCSDTWAWSAAPCRRAHSATLAIGRRVDGAHRVDGGADAGEWADLRVASPVDAATRSVQSCAVPIAEPLLHLVRLRRRCRRRGSRCRAA